MRTAMRLDEWLETNIFTQPGMALMHDTEPPVSKPESRRKKSRLTRTVRKADTELARRRAKFDRETRKHWKTLYPCDS